MSPTGCLNGASDRQVTYEPPVHTVRVLADRSVSLRQHGHRSTHLSGATGEHGSEPFTHFLRTQLNLSPLRNPSERAFPRPISEPTFSRQLFPAMSEHGAVFGVPCMHYYGAEHDCQALPPGHFIMPHHVQDPTHEQGLSRSAPMYTTLDDPVSLPPIDLSHAANGVALPSLAFLSRNRTSPSHLVLPQQSFDSVWEADGAQTLLPSSTCATAEAILRERVTTQENVWSYEPVSDDEWSTASVTHETQIDSSPDSDHLTASDAFSPAASSTSSFDGYNSHAAAQTLQGLSLHAVPPQQTQLRRYPSWVSIAGDRNDSPMFSTAVGDDGQAASILQMHCSGLPNVRPLRITEQGPKATARTRETRHKQDEELIAWRDSGMSYREIKARGGFREAESTLRGRYRALTKQHKDRVRKPVWTTQDCRLLQLAVARHYRNGAYGKPRNATRVPWKGVASWLKENGASYKFAPATCAKKWDEMKQLSGSGQ